MLMNSSLLRSSSLNLLLNDSTYLSQTGIILVKSPVLLDHVRAHAAVLLPPAVIGIFAYRIFQTLKGLIAGIQSRDPVEVERTPISRFFR